MLRLGESENAENQEKAAIRQQLLSASEQGLRASLRTLATNYEVSHLQE